MRRRLTDGRAQNKRSTAWQKCNARAKHPPSSLPQIKKKRMMRLVFFFLVCMSDDCHTHTHTHTRTFEFCVLSVYGDAESHRGNSRVHQQPLSLCVSLFTNVICLILRVCVCARLEPDVPSLPFFNDSKSVCYCFVSTLGKACHASVPKRTIADAYGNAFVSVCLFVCVSLP
jgi:hypothetical protein